MTWHGMALDIPPMDLLTYETPMPRLWNLYGLSCLEDMIVSEQSMVVDGCSIVE